MNRWMQDLPLDIKQKPLNKLLIPGSHDTGAYQLHSDLPLAHDQNFSTLFRTVCKINTVRTIVKRWSETQSLSITEQLNLGIRYLDLRLELASNNACPYLVHALYGAETPSFMEEIKKFMDENPEEIVIVDVNHIYQMSETEFFCHFVQPIEQLFGRDSFCPVMVDIAASTIEELVETNHRLIVVGPFSHDVHGIIYPNHVVQSKWPNVNKIYDLIAFMREEVTHQKTQMHVLQGVMTAKFSDIALHLFGSLKKDLSLPGRKTTTDFVNSVTHQDRQNMNIVITDQVNKEFIAAVVSQNTKTEFE